MNLRVKLCDLWTLTTVLVFVHKEVSCQAAEDDEFVPIVTATCRGGVMHIKVKTQHPFSGVIHPRDHRKSACEAFGDGINTESSLNINLLEDHSFPKYCGVQYNNRTEEYFLHLAVRIHKTLELADDKYYIISCGKSRFRAPNEDVSLVSLKVLHNGIRTNEVLYGKKYTLRIDVSRPSKLYGIRVQSCFSFSGRNESVQLIDEQGCPIVDNSIIMSPFYYNETTGSADATLYKMFRFPDSNKVHFQCEVVVCKGGCVDPECDASVPSKSRAVSAFPKSDQDGVLMAATTVFVLEPGEAALIAGLSDCSGIHPHWLLYLSVAFGILFLIMMLINVFMCSALTCSCTKAEMLEKDPSIMDEYDPYKMAWSGSHYGSRYSLNGKPAPHYLSGGSTRSYSTNSDHYSIVNSRPHSRHSGAGSSKNLNAAAHKSPNGVASSPYHASRMYR